MQLNWLQTPKFRPIGEGVGVGHNYPATIPVLIRKFKARVTYTFASVRSWRWESDINKQFHLYHKFSKSRQPIWYDELTSLNPKEGILKKITLRDLERQIKMFFTIQYSEFRPKKTFNSKIQNANLISAGQRIIQVAMTK